MKQCTVITMVIFFEEKTEHQDILQKDSAKNAYYMKKLRKLFWEPNK